MLVPRKDRLAIFAHLFREGAVACPKNVTATHRQINVPNIYVMKLMLSLKSRNYVTETFNWQWFYYTLTDAGVEYLRNYLHLPAETVPNTHKKVERVAPPPRYVDLFTMRINLLRRATSNYSVADVGLY